MEFEQYSLLMRGWPSPQSNASVLERMPVFTGRNDLQYVQWSQAILSVGGLPGGRFQTCLLYTSDAADE